MLWPFNCFQVIFLILVLHNPHKQEAQLRLQQLFGDLELWLLMSPTQFLYLQCRPQGNCSRGRWTASLSTLAGMRRSLITMPRACYYTTALEGGIILCLFLDGAEMGFGSW